MKFIIAVASLLFIGAVAAQTTAAPGGPGRELVITLERRADALLTRVRNVLTENRGPQAPGGQFFLAALERQLVEVEALALDLKAQTANLNNVFQLHHVHVIEEDLLQLENRVSEEIDVILAIRNGQGRRNETAPQLIARAQQLVKDAHAAVAAHPQAREVREINSEIIVVESLVKAIQARPAPTPAELQKDEEELARQERTLRQLIERANGRQPGRPGGVGV